VQWTFINRVRASPRSRTVVRRLSSECGSPSAEPHVHQVTRPAATRATLGGTPRVRPEALKPGLTTHQNAGDVSLGVWYPSGSVLNLAHTPWMICGAVAHGDNWVLTLFELHIIGPEHAGRVETCASRQRRDCSWPA
jgi:hypothetical protein